MTFQEEFKPKCDFHPTPHPEAQSLSHPTCHKPSGGCGGRGCWQRTGTAHSSRAPLPGFYCAAALCLFPSARPQPERFVDLWGAHTPETGVRGPSPEALCLLKEGSPLPLHLCRVGVITPPFC